MVWLKNWFKLESECKRLLKGLDRNMKGYGFQIKNVNVSFSFFNTSSSQLNESKKIGKEGQISALLVIHFVVNIRI